jgi:hypothetical protein
MEGSSSFSLFSFSPDLSADLLLLDSLRKVLLCVSRRSYRLLHHHLVLVRRNQGTLARGGYPALRQQRGHSRPVSRPNQHRRRPASPAERIEGQPTSSFMQLVSLHLAFLRFVAPFPTYVHKVHWERLLDAVEASSGENALTSPCSDHFSSSPRNALFFLSSPRLFGAVLAS